MKNEIRTLFTKIAFLTVSITQFISPVFSSFDGNNTDGNTAIQITPAGYTFAIWGVITLLGLGYGIYQVLPNRKNEALHQLIASKLMVVYVLFSFWLIAASKNWLILTVIIFVLMFGLLFLAFQQILSSKSNLTIFDKIFLEAQVGIYLGWCTIAIFANLGSALKYYGLSDSGLSGTIWQTVLLIFALSNGIFGLYKTKSNYFLLATILWAFVGVFVGLKNETNTTFLQTVVVLAVIIIFATFYRLKTTLNLTDTK